RVQRDFDLVYAEQDDPWDNGDADSERYRLYRELILEHARERRSILDLGCGFGAFLATFRGDYAELVGVEISGAAVESGRGRYPFIDFHVGSAVCPDALESRRFDAIVLSDVIYYLPEKDRRSALEWIADHLEPDG